MPSFYPDAAMTVAGFLVSADWTGQEGQAPLSAVPRRRRGNPPNLPASARQRRVANPATALVPLSPSVTEFGQKTTSGRSTGSRMADGGTTGGRTADDTIGSGSMGGGLTDDGPWRTKQRRDDR